MVSRVRETCGGKLTAACLRDLECIRPVLAESAELSQVLSFIADRLLVQEPRIRWHATGRLASLGNFQRKFLCHGWSPLSRSFKMAEGV